MRPSFNAFAAAIASSYEPREPDQARFRFGPSKRARIIAKCVALARREPPSSAGGRQSRTAGIPWSPEPRALRRLPRDGDDRHQASEQSVVVVGNFEHAESVRSPTTMRPRALVDELVIFERALADSNHHDPSRVAPRRATAAAQASSRASSRSVIGVTDASPASAVIAASRSAINRSRSAVACW